MYFFRGPQNKDYSILYFRRQCWGAIYLILEGSWAPWIVMQYDHGKPQIRALKFGFGSRVLGFGLGVLLK